MSCTPQAPDGTDYTSMDGPTLLRVCGDNAWNWAHAWKQHSTRYLMDVDAMIGWFANAIMAGHDSAMLRSTAERIRRLK